MGEESKGAQLLELD